MTVGAALLLNLQARSRDLPGLAERIARAMADSIADPRESDLLILAALVYARALHDSGVRGLDRQVHENNLTETFRRTLESLNPEVG